MAGVVFTETATPVIRSLLARPEPGYSCVMISRLGPLKDLVREPDGRSVVRTYPRPDWEALIVGFENEVPKDAELVLWVGGIAVLRDHHAIKATGVFVIDASDGSLVVTLNAA